MFKRLIIWIDLYGKIIVQWNRCLYNKLDRFTYMGRQQYSVVQVEFYRVTYMRGE